MTGGRPRRSLILVLTGPTGAVRTGESSSTARASPVGSLHDLVGFTVEPLSVRCACRRTRRAETAPNRNTTKPVGAGGNLTPGRPA